MAKWIMRNVKARIEDLAKAFNISEIFATILANRGILNKRALLTYINSDEKYFHDSLEMKDMQKAFDILIKAMSNYEKICIYGDYDVDGVTSTTILYKGLKKIGANVCYYIPDREEEGYGLNIKAIDEVKNMGVNLILTCDNGIASIEEVKYIKQNNMDIILLDHHEPRFLEVEGEREDIIPIADAIINPKQKKCTYPFKALCAGGISFKFIKSFYNYIEEEANFDEYLVFASISTVCDIVDLLDENRIIVKKGLEILNSNKNINMGIRELLKLNEIYDKELNESDYGFVLGPCINASGRLESALKAVELFTTEDESRIEELGNSLIELNKERKDMTYTAVEEVLEIIEDSTLKEDKILVIHHHELHESIAGIVAGRIKEIYYKPTFVITKSKEGLKGSGRSIPSYNMFEELLKLKDLFLKFGGHKMAAGLSLKEENLDIFRKSINENCSLTDADMQEVITIDKELKFKDIDFKLIGEISSMKPFGKENREPIFASTKLKIKNLRFVGKNKNIIAIKFIDLEGNILDSISFQCYEKFINILSANLEEQEFEKVINGIKKNIDLIFDVVYSIEENIFNNLKNIQLIIKDIRLS